MFSSYLHVWWKRYKKLMNGVVNKNITINSPRPHGVYTVYPKKYAHGFCFAVLCCGYTLTDFPISIRLTSLALWQSNDCPSASKATLMNMDKYFMWIHYERLHNHNKAKHNKTVCIFLGIYCMLSRVINVSGNDLSLIWRQNITWTNNILSVVERLGTSFTEVRMKMSLKM